MSRLQGKLWLTRSQPGAARLAERLEGANFPCWVGPVLSIQPSLDSALSDSWPLATAQIVVVLSEHAVLHGQALPWQAWVAQGVRVLAVGARTATALEQRGVSAQAPQRSSSEGLLEELLLEPAVRGQRVLLLAGHNGRDSLAQGLAARGALVLELPLYRRVAVQDLVLPQADTSKGGVGAVVVSSGDGMAAVDSLWRGSGRAPDLPVFTPSSRVVELAKGFGWLNAYNCEGASPNQVVATLQSQYPQQ